MDLAEAMYLCSQSVIVETDEGVIDPVPSCIVCAEDANVLEAFVVGFLLRESGHSVRWPPVNGASCPHGSEGIGVVSHVHSDVLGRDLYAIVPDVEGDEAWRDIPPELVRKSCRACLVIGVWCSRSASSLASAHHLSSAVSSPSNVYLHSGPHFACTFRSVLCPLKHSGFLTLSAGSGCIDSSEDVVDEDLMRSTNFRHDVGVSRWWDREWVTLTLVDGLVTGPAFVGVSGATQIEVPKPTGVVEMVAASVTAVAVRSSLSAAMTVGVASSVAVNIRMGDFRSSLRNAIAARSRRLFSSCFARARRSCSWANVVTSFVIFISRNLSAWVQVNPHGLGAVWRQPGGLRSGESTSCLRDCIKYWDGVTFRLY